MHGGLASSVKSRYTASSLGACACDGRESGVAALRHHCASHRAVARALCSGTIEEKVYHRQIFKHMLSKRILVDPRQSQMLTSRNLYDLFSYTEQGEGAALRRVGEG